MTVQENTPDLWRDHLPALKPDGHKYDRGHAVIFGAPEFTGATRLASEACLRAGAGLVTVTAQSRGDVYRAALLPDIMVTETPLKQSNYIRASLAGPGGTANDHKAFIRGNPYGGTRILDADAIPTERDFNCLDTQCILTPHGGEFSKTFPNIDITDRPKAAKLAAQKSGAIVVFKGALTVISHPDGRTVVNTHATPFLAKAGTGDVLAGMITGLCAQGMSAFDAACAGVWIHGEIGQRLGFGFIASDMAKEIAKVMVTFKIAA